MAFVHKCHHMEIPQRCQVQPFGSSQSLKVIRPFGMVAHDAQLCVTGENILDGVAGIGLSVLQAEMSVGMPLCPLAERARYIAGARNAQGKLYFGLSLGLIKGFQAFHLTENFTGVHQKFFSGSGGFDSLGSAPKQWASKFLFQFPKRLG